MSERTCSIKGCDRVHYGRTWCKFHYQRWYIHGAPQKTLVIRGDLPERILSKIVVQDDGCWIWTGGRSAGYGYARWSGRHDLVHRIVYRMLVGPIPDDLELDHTCHTNDLGCAGGANCTHRACANPAHLEPVTSRENSRRSRGANKPQCLHGHDLVGDNVHVNSQGRRVCRVCQRETWRRYRERRRAALGSTGRGAVS